MASVAQLPRTKYKPYPAYHDSGVEWLGQIPADWQCVSTRSAVQRRRGQLNESDDTPVLSLTIRGLRVKTDLSFGKSTESYIGHQLVHPGDLVFTPRDFDCTPILSGVAEDFGCISNLYFVLSAKPNVHNRFVNYYWWGLKYSFDYFRNFSSGMRFSFNYSQFKDIPFLKPPLDIQIRIADFLDRETAEIDALVEKKQRLIELLKEKRAAMITQAVTKGLDPSVPMKDSGVEWLGQIPKHWEVKRLKFVARERLSKIQALPENGLYVGLEHIESWTGRLLTDDQPAVVDSAVNEFASGDILFGKLRPYLAKVALPTFSGFATTEAIVLSPCEGTCGSYLRYALSSQGFIDWMNSQTFGVKMPRLSPAQIRCAKIPVPRIHEQLGITAFLDRETAKIDALIEKNQKMIELLKEYRSALISAAVTGKIDVRPMT